MVCERVRWDIGWSGMDWFPMAILDGIAGGAASVSTLGVKAGVCTGAGDGGGTGVGRLRGNHPWMHCGVLPWRRLGLVGQEDVAYEGEGFQPFICACRCHLQSGWCCWNCGQSYWNRAGFLTLAEAS